MSFRLALRARSFLRRPLLAARSLSVVLLLAPLALPAAQLVPGLYGYGADRGTNSAGFGAGATIYEVTNLSDGPNPGPPGSLRAALRASGRRIVVFRTSGVIELQSAINIQNGDVTIAGQTAPSPGIAIHGAGLSFTASNILVQHLRIRPGDKWSSVSTTNRDATSFSNSATPPANAVFDHCTFSWTLDELASTWYNWNNVTFHKCIFAEPLHVSIHLDENTFSPSNVPQVAENLTNTKSTSFTTTTTASGHAVSGNYQRVNTTADGQWIEYTLNLDPSSSARSQKHLTIVGIKGTNRARFRAEIRDPSNNVILNSGEIVDQYGAEAQHTYTSQQNMTQSFTIPANAASLKVRLIVSGRNPANTTGWTLGIDQLSITDAHGFGPLFSAGGTGTDAGKLAFIGNIMAHVAGRGPWSASREFYYANNILYNRSWQGVHLGHANWDTSSYAMKVVVLGNTFIEGRDASASASLPSPVSNTAVPPGSQIYVGSPSDNAYNYGNRASPPAMIATALSSFLVGSDPITTKTGGLSGVTPLSPANAYAAALLTAGARPADRDDFENRIIDEIATGAGISTLSSRPGSIKHTVASAGGWPTLAANTATWTYPVGWNPNADDSAGGFIAGNGYTSVEEWLQGFSAVVEGSPTMLLGHWQLNEGSGTTTADASGNGNTGTLSPAPTWTTGISGGALDFDGVDDAVNVGSAAAFDNLSALTLTAWMRADSMGESSLGRVIAKSTGTTPVNGWHVCLSGTNGIGFAVDYTTTNLNVISANNAFTTGNWHHVAITWDGSTSASNVNIYVDGIEVGSYATATSAAGTRVDDSGSSVYLGNESTGARTFDGALDDVRLYQGVLSQSEIAALAATGAPSGLGATSAGISQINLAWTDNSANETGFKIERRKGTTGSYAQIATVGANVTAYNDTTCGAGTEYYYRVRSYNGSGDSPYSAAANATTSEVTSGRRAHWKFDENTGTSAADASGNANTGTLTNGPAWIAGKIGSAVSFDAVDDVVTAGSGTTLDDLVAQGGGGMSVAAWIRIDSIGEGGNPGRIVHKGTGTSATNGWQFVTQGTNSIAFASDHATTDLNRVSATNALTPGTWHHVLVTWTGSATATDVKLYVDGAETGYSTTTNASGARSSDAASSTFIGNDNSGARTFDGSIDDVRIYNRVLTASEITAIHRAGL